MAYVDLDKIINIESGGWGVYPWWEDPAPYPVLSQSIGIFNKPDARDGDSNGWFGLLNNSNNAVNAQNNNWNTQMALAVDSWVGALSTRIKSFDFSQNIWQIDWGQIKFGVFQEAAWTQYISIDETEKKMVHMCRQDSVYDWDMRIVTSWWNRFGIIGNVIYSIDADNKILSTITTITGLSMMNSVSTWTVRQVVGNMVWVLWTGWDYYWVWKVEIHPDWSFTEIARSTLENPYRQYKWSYQYWDILYLYFWNTGSSNATVVVVSYKLSDSTSELLHLWLSTWGYSMVTVWFNGTHHYSMWLNREYLWTGLRNLNTWDFVLWWWNRGSVAYQWDENKLLNRDTNVSIASGTSVNILWTTYPVLWATSVWRIFEPTGSNIQDEAFKGFVLPATTKLYNDEQKISLKVNWQEVRWFEWALVTTDIFTQALPIQPIWTKHIEVVLEKTWNIWINQKLALWATWWTYDTPTLPANNGMTSGSATTPRVPWTDASYINLTLAS